MHARTLAALEGKPMIRVCERCIRPFPEEELHLSPYGEATLCEACEIARAEEMRGRHGALAEMIPEPRDSTSAPPEEET